MTTLTATTNFKARLNTCLKPNIVVGAPVARVKETIGQGNLVVGNKFRLPDQLVLAMTFATKLGCCLACDAHMHDRYAKL